MADNKPHMSSVVAVTGYRVREIRVGDRAVDAAITAISTGLRVVEMDIELAPSTVVDDVGDMPFHANKDARASCLLSPCASIPPSCARKW